MARDLSISPDQAMAMRIDHYLALCRSWAKFPPLHAMVGRFIGYGRED